MGREKWESAFLCCQRGVRKVLFWVPAVIQRANFTTSRANEGGGCPQIPCSRDPLRGPHLDLQKGQNICKRRSDGLHVISLKTTWENLLLAARAVVVTENWADVRVLSSRETGRPAVLTCPAATGSFTPGTIQVALQEP